MIPFRSLYFIVGVALLACACVTCEQNDESSLVADLLRRVEALEKRDSVQQKLIVDLQNQLSHQNEDIGSMKRTMVARDRWMRKMQRLIKKKGIFEKTKEENQISNEFPETQESTDRRIRQVGSAPTVAFSTAVSRTSNALISHQYIVFDHVFTNIGGGYSPDNGIFWPPVGGTYVLFMSIYAAQNHDIRARFRVNGIHKSSLHAESLNNADDSSSQTIILHLNKGDVVGVQLFDDAELVYGSADYYSTFSGFLLQQDV